MLGQLASLEPLQQWYAQRVGSPTPSQEGLYDVYSHLVHAIRGAAVSIVIVDGRIVLRDRKMTTLDEREVAAKASELQQRILKSLGLKAP